MKKDYTKQLKFWGALIGVAILALILLFYLQKWNDKKYYNLQSEYISLQKEYDKQKKDIENFEIKRLKERDSIIIEITKREEINKNLSEENKKLQHKLDKLKDKEIIVPTDAPGLVNYYNNRYETEENLVIEDRVGLGINTAYKASYELEEKDILVEIVEIKDEQIQNKDTLIFNLNQDKEDLNSLYSSAEKEIEKRKELQNIAEENIDNLTKQVKKLNKDKFINRVLIPVVALLSGLLGYSLAN